MRAKSQVPRALHRSNAWVVSNVSKHTLKNSNWLELKILNSIEQRPRSIKRIWSDHLSIWIQTDADRHHVHSQHNVRTPELICHSTLAMRDLWYIVKVQNFFAKKRLVKIKWRESDSDWSADVNHRKKTTNVGQHSAVVSRSRPKFQKKQKIRA